MGEKCLRENSLQFIVNRLVHSYYEQLNIVLVQSDRELSDNIVQTLITDVSIVTRRAAARERVHFVSTDASVLTGTTCAVINHCKIKYNLFDNL